MTVLVRSGLCRPHRELGSLPFGNVEDDALEASPQLMADDVDGWDSLNHIRLMLAVQKRFGVKFSAAEVGKLGNVGDLVALVRAKA